MTIREKLLARRPTLERVDVDGFDEPFYVQRLDGAELFKFTTAAAAAAKASADKGEADSPFFVPLLLRTLADADGNRLLTDGDADALARVQGGVLMTLYKVAARVNGMSDETRAAAAGK